MVLGADATFVVSFRCLFLVISEIACDYDFQIRVGTSETLLEVSCPSLP
jgi:hypothetical protein